MLKGAIYGISAAAIWGGMYVISDVVLKVIPPFTLLTIRIVMALLVTLPIILGARLTLPPRKISARLLGVGIVGFGFSLGAQFVGTDKSTAINGALITSASPAFIILFAVLLLREKLTPTRLIAIALATCGVLVILDPTQADFSAETFQGDIVLAVAALTWGLYSVLVRKVTRAYGVDTLVVTVWAFAGGLFITIPAMLVELPARPIGAIDVNIALGILYLGIVSTAIATWLWNRAFALVDASVASLFFFGQPISGVLLSTLFLGQPMTTGLWIGGALIAFGVVLSLRPEKKKSLQEFAEVSNTG